ncbi:MAG: hypothetical protein V5A38_10435 [Halolamina sp.]|uniref:hypothetical protein n=1 Tax=Halolamina sp. TaxID=1940283 RepID=UPI002FC35E02
MSTPKVAAVVGSRLEKNQTTAFDVAFYVRVDLLASGGGTVPVTLDTLVRPFETETFCNEGRSDAVGHANRNCAETVTLGHRRPKLTAEFSQRRGGTERSASRIG